MTDADPKQKPSVTFDWETDSVPERVVSAVAETRGADPMELEQLADRVDPDALDSLFAGGRAGGSITFPFGGCDVTVYARGEIVVRT
jgi:hypothetical protein